MYAVLIHQVAKILMMHFIALSCLMEIINAALSTDDIKMDTIRKLRDLYFNVQKRKNRHNFTAKKDSKAGEWASEEFSKPPEPGTLN